MFSAPASSVRRSCGIYWSWNTKCLILLVLTVHGVSWRFSCDTMQCFYFSCGFGKKTPVTINSSLSSLATCSYFLSSLLLLFSSLVVFHGCFFCLVGRGWQFVMQHTIALGSVRRGRSAAGKWCLKTTGIRRNNSCAWLTGIGVFEGQWSWGGRRTRSLTWGWLPCLRQRWLGLAGSRVPSTAPAGTGGQRSCPVVWFISDM